MADNTTLSTDPPPSSGGVKTERWIGVAAGVVTAVLLAGAISAIAAQFSPASPQDQSTTTTTVPAAAAEPPPAQPAPATPPPDGAPWPVAVIGASCRPYSNNAVTGDGSVAYCARLADTEAFLWSLYPNDLHVGAGEDPSVAVCMAQTGRAKPECGEYLARPSDPGDGQPVAP